MSNLPYLDVGALLNIDGRLAVVANAGRGWMSPVWALCESACRFLLGKISCHFRERSGWKRITLAVEAC